jgi:hypothetical protein
VDSSNVNELRPNPGFLPLKGDAQMPVALPHAT